MKVPTMEPALSRRRLLTMIGVAAGSAASYKAMAQLGLVQASPQRSRLGTRAAKPGASVLVLGGGISGMVAAMELRRVGYQVTVLEYNGQPGGRCWTLRGGDTYTELGGATQHCKFDPGFYLNPGPWRIPYHHHNVLGYCRELGVPLEHQIQFSHNTFLHSSKAFGGKPQRFGRFQAALQGDVSELLAKATHQHALDQAVSTEDQEKLLEALREWGHLDGRYAFTHAGEAADGYVPGPPLSRADVLNSKLWTDMPLGDGFHDVLMQPVGGMDRLAYALFREVEGSMRFHSKVVAITQDNRKVTATYVDARTGGEQHSISADWCVCAMPLTVLGQIPVQVGAKMAAGIRAVPYIPALKVGLQFKRRFWEQDDDIYGGISYTDLPIYQISYPSSELGTKGKGVLLGAYVSGLRAMEFTSLSPDERVQWAVEYGSRLHPQYRQEFENGIAVAWHRVPWIMGCAGWWSDAARKEHYENLRAIDGRLVLAGDHISDFTAWQEGAMVSTLDAIQRLHAKATA